MEYVVATDTRMVDSMSIPADGRPGKIQDVARASEDAQALARLAGGDMAALGELYDRHHAAVRGFLSRATGDADEAEDLVHATFLAVPKAASSFDPTRPCRAWLFGIAVRMMRRQRAAGARWTRMLTRFREVLSPSAEDPERIVSARRDLSRVEEALYEMSEAKRVVLIMAEVEGMSCEQIAEVLNIPVGTVWTRLHHARRGLSAAVAPKEPA
jgi:RNA polymerase sigma-70 factor (ECF subfamily)